MHNQNHTLFLEIFNQEYSKNNNIDEVLNALKNLGASQISCVKILIECLKIPLKEADEIVLNSEAWKKEKQETLKFRDEFTSFLDNKN